jgi:hypothetical protein
LKDELANPATKEERRVTVNRELNTAKSRLETEGEIPKEMQKQKRKIREYTDATFFVDRIARLTGKLEATTDADARTLLEKKIAQTVLLMQEKLDRGMINFAGSSREEGDTRKGAAIANRLAFMQALAKGTIETTIDRHGRPAHPHLAQRI